MAGGRRLSRTQSVRGPRNKAPGPSTSRGYRSTNGSSATISPSTLGRTSPCRGWPLLRLVDPPVFRQSLGLAAGTMARRGRHRGGSDMARGSQPDERASEVRRFDSIDRSRIPLRVCEPRLGYRPRPAVRGSTGFLRTLRSLVGANPATSRARGARRGSGVLGAHLARRSDESRHRVRDASSAGRPSRSWPDHRREPARTRNR
jgi:hypothetical protein